MKKALALLFFIITLPIYPVVEIGEKSPELCWNTVDSKEVCTRQLEGKIAVLVYNTGWCPGCQDEMEELSRRYLEIKNEKVFVISLSAEGFKHGQPANEEFLKAWKKKYQIPFEVAASPNNAGKEFFKPPYYIPASVILDPNGVVQLKKVDASVDEIFSKVRELMK